MGTRREKIQVGSNAVPQPTSPTPLSTRRLLRHQRGRRHYKVRDRCCLKKPRAPAAAQSFQHADRTSGHRHPAPAASAAGAWGRVPGASSQPLASRDAAGLSTASPWELGRISRDATLPAATGKRPAWLPAPRPQCSGAWDYPFTPSTMARRQLLTVSPPSFRPRVFPRTFSPAFSPHTPPPPL